MLIDVVDAMDAMNAMDVLKCARLREIKRKWCQQQESNPQPTDYKSVALPLSHAGAHNFDIVR